MAVQDYELLLRVRADMLQAISGLDGVRKRLDSVGTEAERTGRRTASAVDGINGKLEAVKHVLAGLAIAEGFKAVLDAVTESQDAIAQLDARLRSTKGAAGLTRDELIDLSGAMQQLTTYGDEAVLGAENLLLTFTRIRGPEFKEAIATVLDMSTALGQDLKSSATLVGKALNDPIAGLSALSRVGVTFTDQQKELIKALAESGQTAEAQKVILRELQTEFGGAAQAAAGTFGGALKQLKNAAGDLLEGDGGNLPETAQSVQELTKTLQDPQVKEGFATLVNGLVQLIGLAAKATAAFAGFGRAVADAFKDDADKSLDGLLQKRVRLEEELSDRQKMHQDEAVARIKQEIKDLDALYNARLKASRASVAPVPAPGANAAGAGAGKAPDVETITVYAPKAKSKAGTAGADKSSQYLAAADALRQKLIDLQAALDPTAAAWASYNKAVDEANRQADLAKKAPGANAAAIDAERNAIVQLAQTQRDAALSKLSDQDRQAYERLREELRTPTQVAMENAIAQIKQLNAALDAGIIKGPEYQQQLARIGQNSVVAAPQYQGVDAAVGGPYGELMKNFQAGTDLDAWHQQQLEANEQFRQQDLANEEVYQARRAEIDRQYKEQSTKIEQSRQQLTLTSTSDFLGQLSVLQSSHNRKVAALGKAAAIAKAIIDTYQAATGAYAALASIPYIGPALGAAAAAAAIAAGLANVAQIRSQPTGFAEGGYTGPGGKYQPAGIVHAGEVVWSQDDVRRAGGVSIVEALRLGRAGYADGGLVGPMAGTNDIASRGTPVPSGSDLARSVGAGGGGDSTHIHVWSIEEAAERLAEVPSFQKAVIHIAGENPTAIQAGWNR